MKRFFLACLLCIACSAQAQENWSGTLKAGAGAALDFAECVKTDSLQLALNGGLTKDAMLAAAEKCGVAGVSDVFAILVAVYEDVKRQVIASHQQPGDAGAP